MFCTQCGLQAGSEDKFCRQCGGKLDPGIVKTESNVSLVPPDGDEHFDWRNSYDVRRIIEHPHVKSRIERVAGEHPEGISAEEFMKLFDPALAVAGAPGLSFDAINKITAPMRKSIGSKTRQAKKGFKSTFSETLVATLCSLASRNQPLIGIATTELGCQIDATMPSSMLTYKGDITLELERVPDKGTLLTAMIDLPGPKFNTDWGKCKRAFNDLFEDVFKYRDYEI